MSVAIETTDWQPAPARAREPFVAIGDIHGASHLLRALRERLEQETSAKRIYLGDLIDPSPKYVPNHNVPDVLDQVAEDLDCGGEALAGNHELMMLDFVNCARAKTYPNMKWDTWPRYNNGCDTLSGWMPGLQFWADADIDGAAIRVFDELMTDAQRSVFRRLKLWLHLGKYIFVHGGFERFDLAHQKRALNWWKTPVPSSKYAFHPQWGRFLTSDEAPPKKVQINGHQIMRRPFVGEQRIQIDTGAKIGGPLTAVEIVGDRLRFHHACPPGVTMSSWARQK